MLKKFFIITALGLLFYSVTTVTSADSSFRSGLLAQSAAPPSGELDDAGFSFDLNPIVHEGITGSIKQKWMREGVNYFFKRIIGLLSGIIGGISVLVISYGGFLMLSSAGSEELYRKGVEYIQFAVIGLIVALLAYVMVNAVQLLIHSIYTG